MSSEAVLLSLLGVIAAVVTIVGTVVTSVLVPVLRRKWGLDAKETTLRIHESIGRDATLESEQWRKTERDQGREPEPQELLDRARDRVVNESEARGIAPPPSPTALVEAKVAEARRSVPPPALPEHDDLTDGAGDA